MVVAVGVPVIVAGVVPNNTKLPAWKPVPVIWTAVPPAVGPKLGLTLVMVGAGVVALWATKPLVNTDACPSMLTTLTLTGPALAKGGVMAVMLVAVGGPLIVACVLPRNTLLSEGKPVP